MMQAMTWRFDLRAFAAALLLFAMLVALAIFGARTGWLQVEADNAAGRALYAGLGFSEAYRYCYRAPPGIIV